MNTQTIAGQSELIRLLSEENAELRKENKKLKHDLYDAQAIIVCNRIVRPEGFKKTYIVPARAR